MNDRIRIINSFRSNFGERKKSIDNRLLFLKFLVIFIIVIFISSTYSALSTLMSQFNLWINFNWFDAEFLVLGALTFIIMAPTILFEIQLLNHLKEIKEEESKHNSVLINKELQKTINDLNKNGSLKILMIVLTVILMIGSLINSDVKGDILYWKNFIIPYFLLMLIIVIQIINGYYKLRQNIKAYEEQ